MITKKKWDSDFFGILIGEINSGNLDILELQEYDLVQSCVNINDADINKYISSGFTFIDLRIELQKNPSNYSVSDNCEIVVNPDISFLSESDITELSEGLVGLSRFNEMPINRRQIHDFYSTWITKAIQKKHDNFSIFCKQGVEVVGVLTARMMVDECKVGLVSVKKQYQGSGYGSILLSALEKYALTNVIKKISIVTEGKNIQAQRFYQKNGYVTNKIDVWLYHKKSTIKVGK